MGFRFKKSKQIAPGVRVNLNKKSASVTFGSKGVHHTISSSGKKTTSAGIPGSGLYYTSSSGGGGGSRNGNEHTVSSASGGGNNTFPRLKSPFARIYATGYAINKHTTVVTIAIIAL